MKKEDIQRLINEIKDILPGASHEQKILIYEKLSKIKTNNVVESTPVANTQGNADYLEEA